jgi:hypothetical protein
MTNDGGLEQFGRRTLADDGCSTCGDVAVPVKVIAVHGGEAGKTVWANARPSPSTSFPASK